MKLCLHFDEGTDLRGFLAGGADDAALTEAVRAAVWGKPAHHLFGETAAHVEQRKMVQIGGIRIVGKVIAVCTSERRGIQKTNIHSAQFRENWGIEGDAHAGDWHRQVSLLSFDKIEAFRARGAEVGDGAFGENLVVEGIDFRSLPVGTVLECNGVVLEMTQIGQGVPLPL